MTRRPLLAHLCQDNAGQWVLWVDVPGVPSEHRPSVRLGGGDGPSVAVRTAALAGLGFEPARPRERWSWEEVAPGLRVALLGTMPVGPVSVASPPAPRRSNAAARVPRKAAAPKRAAAAARTQPAPAARRADTTRTAAPRRAAVAPPTRLALDAPPPAGLALPARSAAAAALPPGTDARTAGTAGRPLELEAREPLALPPAAPRPRTVLDELLPPRPTEAHRR